jgi:hypothetical protein
LINIIPSIRLKQLGIYFVKLRSSDGGRSILAAIARREYVEQSKAQQKQGKVHACIHAHIHTHTHTYMKGLDHKYVKIRAMVFACKDPTKLDIDDA